MIGKTREFRRQLTTRLGRGEHLVLYGPARERQVEPARGTGGRVGWIAQCNRLIGNSRYWRGGALDASVLCAGTEITLRAGPWMLWPDVSLADRGETLP